MIKKQYLKDEALLYLRNGQAIVEGVQKKTSLQQTGSP
jgi:hypothetical protein